jgi:hypothetical protein
MNSQYIDQDTLDEIRNAYGMGVSLETLAAQLGIAEEALRRLMGLPEWQPEPPLQKSLDWTR